MPKAPPAPGTKAEGGGVAGGCPDWEDEPRSPAPPQVAGGGLCESVNEGSKRMARPLSPGLS